MPRDIAAFADEWYAFGAGQKSSNGAYTSDQSSTGAGMGTDSVSHAIDMSAVAFASPAPLSVYQGERYGSSFSYILPNLTPGKSYTVRLHFAETYYTAAGKRKFNVSINGTRVLTNFDIVAAAGAGFKANIQTFHAVASGSGTISVQFAQGAADWPKVSGVEIY
ncbi:hypothetical protein IGX34_18425 [Dyella sp. 7MK23]|uniref:Malectin domain-containing protein n=2 Tax=Dyella acidiphila TaxID=2775866 RepID=A0ABR9GEC1_9GAMM|nr:hypothetical protein [Dyella acidiphila]